MIWVACMDLVWWRAIDWVLGRIREHIICVCRCCATGRASGLRVSEAFTTPTYEQFLVVPVDR